MKNLDEHIDRQQAAHTDQQDADEALAQAREEAIDEMIVELVAGKSVRYGSTFVNGTGVIALEVDSSDVRDEIDGEELRGALGFGRLPWYPARNLWLEAARRVCKRHVDKYLEWRTTL